MKSHIYYSSLLNARVILLIGALSLYLCNKSDAQFWAPEKTELSKLNLYADVGIFLFALDLYHVGLLSGGFASINFEGRMYSDEKVTLYGRIGAGGIAIVMYDGGFGGPAAITMLTGKGKHHFETNGGVFIYYGNSGYTVFPLLDLGYRYQKPEGGFVFRGKVGITGVGIGLGYAF